MAGEPVTGLPGIPPALILPVLALVAVVFVGMWWTTMRTKSGMAQRAAVRRTLGKPALRRAVDEMRPSLRGNRR